MIDLKKHETEALEWNKFYKLYRDKRKETMKITTFKVQDVLSDILSKESISREQLTKLNNFLAKLMWTKILVWR